MQPKRPLNLLLTKVGSKATKLIAFVVVDECHLVVDWYVLFSHHFTSDFPTATAILGW